MLLVWVCSFVVWACGVFMLTWHPGVVPQASHQFLAQVRELGGHILGQVAPGHHPDMGQHDPDLIGLKVGIGSDAVGGAQLVDRSLHAHLCEYGVQCCGACGLSAEPLKARQGIRFTFGFACGSVF